MQSDSETENRPSTSRVGTTRAEVFWDTERIWLDYVIGGRLTSSGRRCCDGRRRVRMIDRLFAAPQVLMYRMAAVMGGGADVRLNPT